MEIAPVAASGSQQHCWSIAFSSLDNVIAPLVGGMVDLELLFPGGGGSGSGTAGFQQQQQHSSSEIPVVWLGKLCLTTLSHGVNHLCSSMRQWSINLVVHMLFTAMLMINPRLTRAQQLQLLGVTTRATEQLFSRHTLDQRLLRGILALACPDRGSRILLTYLIEILQGLTTSITGSDAAEGDPEDPESGGESCESEAGRALHQEFSVERVYVSVMPPAVRRAVLAALTRDAAAGRGEPAGSPGSPRCCITLEPLVSGNGKVRGDVVAVLQGEHAFLYRGTALYKWLGKPQLPVAPETRSVVRPMDVYRLSS